MRHIILLLVSILFAALWTSSATFATSVKPLSPLERIEQSGAIARGTVESVVSFRGTDGFIYTEAVVAVNETFKGTFPSRLSLRYRGGFLDHEGESFLEMPPLAAGEERVFFLAQHRDGRLATVAGPAGAPSVRSLTGASGDEEPGVLHQLRDVFSSPAEGLDLTKHAASAEGDRHGTQTFPPPVSSSVPENGLLAPPHRFTFPDRGEPIRYLVDADELPPGISSEEALEAVENALNAWADVSSVQFEFEGLVSFGEAASDIDARDRRLRIQLHDSYESIGNSNTLGVGGQAFTSTSSFPDGGTGGRVNDIEFHQGIRASIILNHTATSMQNLKTFEAVLAHEIGHTLGLAHSSEEEEEEDPYLSEAIMYYRINTDDRGASLGDWDIDTIARTHPTDTPPPFGFDRYLRVVASNDPLANPEVNEVEIRGYSLHADRDTLTAEMLLPSSNNGTFSFDDKILTFTPNGAFSDSDELAPEEGSAFDSVYFRLDDGINLSPPFEVRVIQFLLATQPPGEPDGLPDSWRDEHFGSSEPVSGLSGADDDPDGDGLTNLQEFLLGTDPRDPNSRFTVTDISSGSIGFQARPYEVYELHTSPNLTDWSPSATVVQPTSETGEIPMPISEETKRFFRVKRVR